MNRRAETGVVALALGVLAAVVYGPHAIHGGFISDAWVIRAIYEFAPDGGFLGGVEEYLENPNIIPRPLQAIYFAGQNALFGSDMTAWLGWHVALSAVMSTALYVLLREFDFKRVDAAAISALVLIFPAASSIKFWTAPVSTLTMSLAAFGFVLALRAFRARGRSRILLHGASLAMFAASLLLYELVLLVMLASVLLYRLSVPWRPALGRWLVDCAVLIPTALTVTRSESSAWEVQSVAGMWDHLVVIADQASTLLATVVFPFGGAEWLALSLLTLLPAGALVVVARLDRGSPARAALRRWLATIAAGLAIVVLGYAIYVPGDDTYVPLGAGIGNRVNAVPSVGWVLVLYGLTMLGATMACCRLARARQVTYALALAACAAVSVNWLQSIDRDSAAFVAAYEEGQRVLRAVEVAVPAPPPSSVIWTFGRPSEIAPGVPVLGAADMTTSVRLMYGDRTLRSFVAFSDTTLDCRRDHLAPGGWRYAAFRVSSAVLESPYGRTYFVDTASGAWERIDSRRQCERAVGMFPRAPDYPV